MPNPVTTYQTLKFLWNESRPVRDWLWSRMPSIRDQRKREAAEEHLAKLLDDANSLAQALPKEDLDASIDQRLERFKLDLAEVKIPKDEAELLTERASLFVRLMVTGPLADIVALRRRMSETEQELEEQQKLVADMQKRLLSVEEYAKATAKDLDHHRKQLYGALLVGVILLFVALIFMALQR